MKVNCVFALQGQSLGLWALTLEGLGYGGGKAAAASLLGDGESSGSVLPGQRLLPQGSRPAVQQPFITSPPFP